ncbi:MAG TPA: response regulator [Chthoniobacter sp.]|nr:response regulator [Chthoniobacter sp.]
MSETPTILITDDDDGHAFLIEDNLRRSGVNAPFLRFSDGQEVLDFLFGRTTQPAFEHARPYLLLLDIRMPKIDGVTVLRQIKSDAVLRKLPVIMVTTTDDPREVARCHDFGCNIYLQKPVSYDGFASAINKLGTFVNLLRLPTL